MLRTIPIGQWQRTILPSTHGEYSKQARQNKQINKHSTGYTQRQKKPTQPLPLSIPGEKIVTLKQEGQEQMKVKPPIRIFHPSLWGTTNRRTDYTYHVPTGQHALQSGTGRTLALTVLVRHRNRRVHWGLLQGRAALLQGMEVYRGRNRGIMSDYIVVSAEYGQKRKGKMTNMLRPESQIQSRNFTSFPPTPG